MGLIELRKNLQKANLKRLRSKKILKIIVGSKPPYEISRNIPLPPIIPPNNYTRDIHYPSAVNTRIAARVHSHTVNVIDPRIEQAPPPPVIGNSDREKDLRAKKRYSISVQQQSDPFIPVGRARMYIYL